jgi:hypothetical protein
MLKQFVAGAPARWWLRPCHPRRAQDAAAMIAAVSKATGAAV